MALEGWHRGKPISHAACLEMLESRLVMEKKVFQENRKNNSDGRDVLQSSYQQ